MSTIVYTLNKKELTEAAFRLLRIRHPELQVENINKVSFQINAETEEVSIQVEVNT